MMDKIPEDVREAAAKVVVGLGIGGSSEKSVDGFSVRDAIARAIMAERERAASIAEEVSKASYHKQAEENIRGHHVRGVYVGSFLSWVHESRAEAASEIATAIRSPSP